ncbi:zinc finger BED domain-containing protein RICESLEEPER 2-like [Senna tora]|uniref:Zinc finger BED domain-containing protein RICESLEEPER 2-like n=1 Tax=Senna tora TaxID=362788 RepID=A0A835C693_9FABA|nr:zinc finger BED domain-containing protein RICESLEEPER 2-like [Senna tora]
MNKSIDLSTGKTYIISRDYTSRITTYQLELHAERLNHPNIFVMAGNSSKEQEETNQVQRDDTEDPSVKKGKKRKPPASGKKKHSVAWDHFIKLVDDQAPDEHIAECKHCEKRYRCDPKVHGTCNLIAHLSKCPEYPYALKDSKQQVLGFEPKKDGGGNNMIKAPQVYDVEECRKAIAIFVIADEHPFKVVEGYGFKYLISRLHPQLHIPSRFTVARDCYQLYLDEKLALKAFLQSNCARRVFTLTVDNASSNDVAIGYMKKRMKSNLVLDGDFMHVRCCAHILNLIVSDGLKELHSSIAAIRNAVRFVRSSPSRLAKFKQCIEQAKITSQSLVCLDVPTRWNSTYLMLEAAQKFQIAFERLEDDDSTYMDYFDEKTIGPPSHDDWKNAKVFVEFLKIFYDVTLELSGSLYVTSNLAFPQLALVQSEIVKHVSSYDPLLSGMAFEMKKKFDKYWGKAENMNPLLFIANVLDPRYKLAYLKWSFDEIHGVATSFDMISNIKADLQKLYQWYCQLYEPKTSSNIEGQSSMSMSNNNKDATKDKTAQKAREAAFKSHLREASSIEAKNEVEKYLAEAIIDVDDKFDVLHWWKTNMSRFRVLSCIARDVLAVPVSTIASESAFSTGGRVLDTFRSSLSPRMTAALICAQNWLRPTIINLDISEIEEMAQCEKIEMELGDGKQVGHSMDQQPMIVD